MPRATAFAALATLAAYDWPGIVREMLDARERELLEEALARSGGRRREAAQLLGIDPRNLSYYLLEHGIEPDAIRRPPGG